MNESNADAKKLGDIVVDYVSKKKITKLENAFRNNPVLMQHVRAYSKAHDEWMGAHDRLMAVLNKVCSQKKCDTDI